MRHFYQIEYLSVLLKYSVFCQHFEIREILASCWTSAANLKDEKIWHFWQVSMSCPMMYGGLYEPMIRFTTFWNCDEHHELCKFFLWFMVLACLFTYTLVQVCRWELTSFRAFCQLADMLVPIFLLISWINFYSWERNPFWR